MNAIHVALQMAAHRVSLLYQVTTGVWALESPFDEIMGQRSDIVKVD
jgi:hypothetical protein